jgi:hypothetical protein
MSAGACGGTKETTTEARALFIGPVDQTNRDGRLAMKFFRERAKYL